MQKTFSKEFKFKVAIEAIQGDLTIPELISKYQISKTAIHAWKKQVLDYGASLFIQKHEESLDEKVDALHKIIGKLKVENDFLQDAWKRLKP